MRGKGEGAVFKDSRGLWTAVVELPASGGKRRRKVVRSKDKKTVLAKLATLTQQLEERGDLNTSSMTVRSWFLHWYENIATKTIRPNTASGYRAVMNKYVIPTIGHVKLEKVTADHVRMVTAYMVDELGMSSTSALNAHRTMSSAFSTAVREGKMYRNPAKLLSAPRKAASKLDVLTLEEGIAVLEHVSRDPANGARWATALLTGTRRGETIGLEMDRVTDVLDLSWQIQRLATGARGTKGDLGKPDVPADFEYRHLEGGLYLTRPKSKAGWRIIPLVDPLRSILDLHIAANQPAENGLLFTRPDGRPIDPAQDSKDWRRVLAATGIEKNVRLHDLRHTTVDLLLLAGVPADLISEIVGHSSWSTTVGYKSRGNVVRLRAAMEQMSALFNQPTGAPSETRALDG